MTMEYWRGHCHLIGHQPVASTVRSMQKEGAVPSAQLVPNIQRQLPTGQPIIGLTANVSQDFSGAQPGNHIRTGHRDELSAVHPIIGLSSRSVKEVACASSSRSTSIDQICDENIQLFMRCEEHMQKENDLKQTVEKLEKELEETKRKCAQLSSHLENRRKQKLMMQQT
ncbi:unnamed protein product [Ilex paraguariensis]|uniref:Uncharacterized protein n=1 Tax=Ilex paraguariensis TaxID=185542 RepID=A0ABC8SIR5_9AQUA